ncbi:zinc-binding dehydrogenase [Amycolatopsis sp. lyj-23]|uniref:zinc-binding dehydrogenase n=1 Tax=Amycolatopsis sp. lyj-23 TaxID=2789283 RepID=UPI00397BD1CA
MRAVVCHHHELTVAELPDPVPGQEQLVLEVQRCGICGSDLHSRLHADDLADVLAEIGYPDYMRVDDAVVLGHEIYGVVAEHGPGTRRKLAVGTPVVTLPLVRHGGEVHAVGLSAKAPGGYAERVVVQEALTLAVPNGLAPDLAALTEPMAVAWHAVNRGRPRRGDVAVVLGCGPVGLAVISVLKSRGIRTIVASDLSPLRRQLAVKCGADLVVDPREASPFDNGDRRHFTTMQGPITAAMDAVDGLSRLPVPWWHTWRLLDKAGITAPKAPVVFECVGVPGMLERVLADTPLHSKVVVVGVCMGTDQWRPAMAINKEIDLRFVVGYTPLEFRDTLHALAEGHLDASPLLTGRVGLAGVSAAFAELADPQGHAKVLIDPRLPGQAISAPE